MRTTSAARNKWRGTTRTLGVLAVLVALLALAVGVSMAAPASAPEAPLGKSSIGDCVWNDLNVNGNEDAPAEAGIVGVVVNLYKENGTVPGNYDSSEFVISQTTAFTTSTSFTGACANGGYYSFNVDGLEVYWVEIDPSNFLTGGVLEDYIWTNKYTANPSNLTKSPFGDNRIYTKVDMSSLVQASIDTADFGFVKVDARVRINPHQKVNKVGDPHDFEVRVESLVGSGAWTAEIDETPTVTVTPSGAVTGNTCTSPGTTSGKCVVTINSNTPSVYTANAGVNASVAVNLPGFFFNPVTFLRQRDTDPATTTVKNGTDPGAGPDLDTTKPATKTYVDLRIKLSLLTATNKVGDPHTFTALVEQNLGTGGWTNVANGTTVSFALLNNTALAVFVPASPTSCTTTAGQCTITINSSQAGKVDLQASVTNVNVSGVLISRTTGVSPNTSGGNGGTGNASKTYVDLRIKLSLLTATNKVGDNHTFTALVEQNLGTGSWTTVANGTTVSFALLNNTASAVFVPASPTSCTTTAGQCTITINSSQAGKVDLQASVTNVNVSGVLISRTTGVSPNTSGENGGTGNASKTYVDLRIKLSLLTATNKVGDPHTFTALVEQNLGTGGWTNVANGTTVSFALLNNTALAVFVPASPTSCTTTAGQCTITINSSQAGKVDLQASVTNVNVSGVLISRTTGVSPNTSGGNGGTGNASKTYVDLRIKLSLLTATNKVDDNHTFTALVEQNLGTGSWTTVANGTTVSFALLNNTVLGVFVPASPTSCTTTAGQCTITINGVKAGKVDLQASVTNVNVSGVLISRTTGVSPNTSGENGGTGNASKTYVDLRISITPLTAVNSIGDAHTFTATVEQNLGTGAGWVKINGAPVTFQLLSGSAGFVSGLTCTTGSAALGQCTVQITSNTVGLNSVRASTTFPVSSLTIIRETGTSTAAGTANTAAFVNDGVSGNDGYGADASKEYVAGAIGNFVWWDANGDGKQTGEQGINGVPVRLYNATCTGTVLGSTTTGVGVAPNPVGVNGYYYFGNLPKGTYCVVIDTSTGPLSAAGWSETTPNVAGNTFDTIDSDIVNGQIKIITLDPVNSPRVAGVAYDDTNDAGYVHNANYTISKVQNSDVDGKGVKKSLPISFTIRITNTGNSWLATIPLTDTFDYTYLSYTSATVNGISTGAAVPSVSANDVPTANKKTLTWTDVTDVLSGGGQLAPNNVLVIVVNFIAIKDTTKAPLDISAQAPCTNIKETCNTTGANSPTPDPDGPTGPLNPQGSLPTKEAHDDIKIVDPTAVSLADTSAQFSAGVMTLRWTTVSEANVLGFTVRRIGTDGTKVVGTMQAQRPGQATGATYQMVDSTAEMGQSYTYVLESMEADGSTSTQELTAIRWFYLPLTTR